MIDGEQQDRAGDEIRFDEPATDQPPPEAWQPGDDSGEVVGKAADLMPKRPGEEETLPEPEPEPETEVEASEARDNEPPGLVSDADADDALEAKHEVERQAAREAEPEPEDDSNGGSPDREYRINLVRDDDTEEFVGTVTAKNTEGAFRRAAKMKNDKDEYVLPDGTHDLVAVPIRYRTRKSVACGPRSAERGVRVG